MLNRVIVSITFLLIVSSAISVAIVEGESGAQAQNSLIVTEQIGGSRGSVSPHFSLHSEKIRSSKDSCCPINDSASSNNDSNDEVHLPAKLSKIQPKTAHAVEICTPVNLGTSGIAQTPSNKTYSLSFLQSGLYSSSKWYVNSTGSPSFNSSGPLSGSKNSYSVNLVNGSYSFTIQYGNGNAPVASYSESAYSSRVVVNGSAENVSVTFIPLYSILFKESGLYFGSTWTVTSPYFGSSGPISSTDTYISYLSNSSTGYPFSVTSSIGTSTKPSSYSVLYQSPAIVNGTNETLDIKFTPEFQVKFNEIGLPNETKWYVNISHQTPLSSSTSSMSTILPNSTYSYVVSSTNTTWAPQEASGSFTLDGTSLSIAINFLEVTYKVTFNETGLPIGIVWYVNISGQRYLNSNNSTITSELPNGTYTFTIATPYKLYKPTQSSGVFVIEGKDFIFNVTFLLVTYVVIFFESGLPPSALWYVNISGQTPSGAIKSQSFSISLPNGTYFQTIDTGDKQYRPFYNTTFSVNGSSEIVQATFRLVSYEVIFTQRGLYSGSWWYINSTGFLSFASSGALRGSVDNYTVSLPNGSYILTVSYGIGECPADIYSQSLYNMTLIVNGGPVNLHIDFVPMFKTTFTESGLYSASKWYVNSSGYSSLVSSGALLGITNSYSVDLSNGSYNYSIYYGLGGGKSAGYLESNYVSPIDVDGSNCSIFIKFTPLYKISFYEYGLPLFTKWEVNVAKETSLSTGVRLYLLVPNGTYHYQGMTLSIIGKGYTSSGYFSVTGGSSTVSVLFLLNFADIYLFFLIPIIIYITFYGLALVMKRVQA